ncbi:serine/arginine-rich SC35-like splicing factor SCL28 isoform X1 [Syzygium oleosum]|uniref:serine/arginine-rich SC35-like splicing factor SCL28 isoform X1 n=1 Tax=Syzygium oleosum TaxID=219896 RepID=UPI0011D254D6|nr:serine/arginine-rich SC35-like splicing factor SCL28 isoform X1 [Syzygium oleosum]
MARYRSRSRSFSPRRRSRSPPAPRARKRHGYDEDPRDRRAYHRDRRSPAPSGLLLRNLPLDTRAEDLRVPFERFGPVKDVYLPKNYYTGEPRGFGFVKFRYAEDAAEAKQQMNHTVIGGREIRIVFAEENRKTPHEMRVSERVTDRVSGRHRERRRSTSRSPRRHNHSYSRSPTPDRHDSRSRGAKDQYHSPMRSGSVSHSPSPREHKVKRSSKRSPSLREDSRSPIQERGYPAGRSHSPRGNIHGPSGSRSRSYSPH